MADKQPMRDVPPAVMDRLNKLSTLKDQLRVEQQAVATTADAANQAVAKAMATSQAVVAASDDFSAAFNEWLKGG